MIEVFADAAYFVALSNPADGLHHRASSFANDPSANLVTTEWVLAEYCSLMSKPPNRAVAVILIAGLRVDATATVIPASTDAFEAGFELYRGRPDKSWSLVDCIAFNIMKQRGITRALTFDHHFEQAGFTALLR